MEQDILHTWVDEDRCGCFLQKIIGFYTAHPEAPCAQEVVERAEAMKEKRARLDRDPKTMEALTRKLNRQEEFILETEDYKRPKAAAPAPLLEPWYQAKSLTVCHEEKLTEDLFSRAIVDRLKKGFAFLLPFYDYFVTLDGDPDPREQPAESR